MSATLDEERLISQVKVPNKFANRNKRILHVDYQGYWAGSKALIRIPD